MLNKPVLSIIIFPYLNKYLLFLRKKSIENEIKILP